MITYIIIAVTGIFSYMAFSDRGLFAKFLFDPYLIKHKKQYYRIITHAFLHGGWSHLLINMFVLWQFGVYVEDVFQQEFGVLGSYFYIVLYFGGIIFSSIPSLKKHGDNPYYTSIGASGAVAAVLFSYILMFPTRSLYFMAILPIPAIIFGAFYLWYEKRLAGQNVNDGIGHDAHYYGAVFGFLISIILKPAFVTSFFNQITSAIGL